MRDPGDDDDMVPLGAVLDEIKDDAFQHQMNKARDDIIALTGGDLGGESSKRRRRPMFEPAIALWADNDDDEVDLVEPLVPDKALTVQASDPKTGKTWIEEEIAMAIATATPAFGTFPTQPPPRTVAIILCEDSRRSTRHRLNAIAASRGLSHAEAVRRIYFICRPSFNLIDINDLAWIVASVRALPEKPALLIIDPLRDAWIGDESEEMDKVTRVLRHLIVLLECAVFITHHNRKASQQGRRTEQAGDDMRGGGELRGRLDSGIYPRRKSGNDDPKRISLDVATERRDAEGAGKFGLDIVIKNKGRIPHVVEWTVMRGGDMAKAIEDRVVDALKSLDRDTPGDFFSQRDIGARANMRVAEAAKALGDLLSRRSIERSTKRGGYRLRPSENQAA